MSDPRFAGRPLPPPLDLIDEHENILGQLDYLTIHKEGRLHKYVHGIVIAADGRLLLQKRSDKNRNYPRTWDASIGGHVDAGESYEQTLLREAQEEIGLTLAAADLIPLGRITNFDLPVENMIGRLFVIRHNGPFTIDPHEVEAAEWFTPAACFALFDTQPGLFCKNFHSSLELFRSLSPHGQLT